MSSDNLNEFIASVEQARGKFSEEIQRNIRMSWTLISAAKRGAHELLTSIPLRVVQETSGRVISNSTPFVSYQIGLVTNLVKQEQPTVQLLASGVYLGAAALIRQAFEMNARLAELQTTLSWVDGRTPNVKFLGPALSRFYGELSELAHFSKRRVEELTVVVRPGQLPFQSVVPAVDEGVLNGLFDRHLVTVMLTGFHIVKFAEVVYDLNVKDDYLPAMEAGLRLLNQAGIVDGDPEQVFNFRG